MENRNVQISDNFGIFALRDINVGEELYIHYGWGYWITKLWFISNDPLVRLFSIMKTKVLKIIDDKIIFDDRVINPTIILDALPISNDRLIALGIVENSPHNKIMALMKFIS